MGGRPDTERDRRVRQEMERILLRIAVECRLLVLVGNCLHTVRRWDGLKTVPYGRLVGNGLHTVRRWDGLKTVPYGRLVGNGLHTVRRWNGLKTVRYGCLVGNGL